MPVSDRMKTIIRAAILILSAALIIRGALGGDFFDVWSKAAMICRECIGLG